MFITFEGLDKTGKSTIINKVFVFLKKKNYKVIKLFEPGSTFFGNKIKNILLNNKNIKLHKKTELLLFLSCRKELIEKVIKPKLKENYIILCDRFYDSTIAYQHFGNNIDYNEINKINNFLKISEVKPNNTFFFHLNFEQNWLRIRKNIDSNFENKKKFFFKKVYNGYLEIEKMNKKRIKRVDTCKKTIEEVYQKVLKDILVILTKNAK